MNVIKKIVKKIVFILKIKIMQIALKTQITSSLYWLFAGGFSREHQAVLAGKLKYYESLKNPRINTSLLRRNIHRLEKGMLMRPRRLPFGLEYIEETVEAYVNAVQANTEPTELAWAYDVLREYMEITPKHSRIDPLRPLITKNSYADTIANNDKIHRQIPYVREDIQFPNISYDELLKLAKFRRSVRWYLDKSVPRHMIEKAIEVASYSPTACNRQPYEFRIYDDSDLVSKIIKLPGGTTGWSKVIPALAVVIGKQRNYFGQHDRHCIYTDASLAIMSLVYALEVQGLSSCCINWPDIEEKEKQMQSLLALEQDERPIMLIAFGWPDTDGMVACSTKKPVNTLCKYNQHATFIQ